jgi:predicted metal-binding membrane protein
MSGMDGWLMQPEIWSPGYAVLVFFMWCTMMTAMMLPSAAPMLLLFARIIRTEKNSDSVLAPTSLFAAGYLVGWGAFGALATLLQWGLEWGRMLSPMLEATNQWLGAGILIAAGLWQLTPLKTLCLGQCRTPLGFLLCHWRPGRLGALRMGLAHAGYCLGCCWFLMGLLFFGGVMNLYWIAGLALYVLIEKAAPFGPRLARMSGGALIALGVLTALRAL